MLFSAERAALRYAQEGARSLLEQPNKPSVGVVQNIGTFTNQLGYSLRLIVEEKEIILFAILQWSAIVTAYLVWTQIMDWIPDSLWQEAQAASDRGEDGAFHLIGMIIICWSFLIIAAVAYPIALFSGAMVAAHYLRHAGVESTPQSCLQLAYQNLGRAWIFSTIDAWITVDAIIDRLPRHRKRRTAQDELLYYAWKIGTAGVLPALVAGRSFADAAKDSLHLLKNHPLRTVGIRMGYSFFCWLVGIGAYVFTFYYLCVHGQQLSPDNQMYNLYLLMAVPIMAAVAVVTIGLRPFFLIMAAKLYTDALPSRQLEHHHATQQGNNLTIIFVVLLSLIGAMVMFGQELGVVQWIESIAAQDIENYRKQ